MVEDYAGKMPFAFTGELKKFAVVLEPDKLTEDGTKAPTGGVRKGYDVRSLTGRLQFRRDRREAVFLFVILRLRMSAIGTKQTCR